MTNSAKLFSGGNSKVISFPEETITVTEFVKLGGVSPTTNTIKLRL